MFRLDNKIAVITGAGSGIGKAMAILFAKQGATVHLIDIDEIKTVENNSFAYQCDVTDQAKVISVFKKIGPVNILVNNAGIANIGKADTTTEKDFDRVMNVNVKGAYNCIYAVIPQMRLTGGGIIINM